MEWFSDPQAWIALATLTALEIVLGVDNIIFISILVGRLPTNQQPSARTLGLGLAMLTRIGLLFCLTWAMGLTEPLFSILDQAISGRDIILIAGGLFLLSKSTHEIHSALEIDADAPVIRRAARQYISILVQVALLDIVFSLDSVITAVGLVDQLSIMVIAIMLAVAVMMLAAGAISRFVNDHPTIKMLALSFLILIGFALVAEGLDFHIPRGYIYFAMAFSVMVELLNMKIRNRKSA
ncbi:MAG: TerC family protein [Gammaproteobacteria bacterium]|nr:TerC family protein [Gammaproteobacteria bacterium]